MVLSHDCSQLFVAAEDGAVTVLDVKDRVGVVRISSCMWCICACFLPQDLARGAGKGGPGALWSEDVLVSKSELEEQARRTAELEQQVQETKNERCYDAILHRLVIHSHRRDRIIQKQKTNSRKLLLVCAGQGGGSAV